VADWADKKAIEVFSRESGCVGLDDMAAALRQARMDALEEAARIASTRGVYPELNVHNGGPEWYRHGQEIAAIIRDLKERQP
jgi:hypothetical protein